MEAAVVKARHEGTCRKGNNGTKKGAWGMPRLSEAKKDVTSCEKPRRGANTLRPSDIRMGQPGGSDPVIREDTEANAAN